MPDDCFYEIPHTFLIDTKEVIDKFGDLNNWGEYYAFRAKPLPNKYIEQNKFLTWLNNIYNFELILFYYPPYYIYNWHIDIRRGATLNMLLNFDGDSHCIFCKDKEFQDKKTFYFQELVYKPNKFYLFNTQVSHSVYNFDKPRFLIGTEFKEKKDTLSYKKIKETIMQYVNS